MKEIETIFEDDDRIIEIDAGKNEERKMVKGWNFNSFWKTSVT